MPFILVLFYVLVMYPVSFLSPGALRLPPCDGQVVGVPAKFGGWHSEE